MNLKELEKVLRGVNTFTLLSRDENSNIVELDKCSISELKYLPASIIKREVLEIDLEKNEIFLDKYYSSESEDAWHTKEYVEVLDNEMEELISSTKVKENKSEDDSLL